MSPPRGEISAPGEGLFIRQQRGRHAPLGDRRQQSRHRARETRQQKYRSMRPVAPAPSTEGLVVRGLGSGAMNVPSGRPPGTGKSTPSPKGLVTTPAIDHLEVPFTKTRPSAPGVVPDLHARAISTPRRAGAASGTTAPRGSWVKMSPCWTSWSPRRSSTTVRATPSGVDALNTLMMKARRRGSRHRRSRRIRGRPLAGAASRIGLPVFTRPQRAAAIGRSVLDRPARCQLSRSVPRTLGGYEGIVRRRCESTSTVRRPATWNSRAAAGP